MTKALVYTNNGLLEIDYPNTSKGVSVEDLTPPVGVTDCVVLDMGSSLDTDFRNSWVLTDGVIGYDLEKARGIQLEKIRLVRRVYLENMDNEIRKGEDRGLGNGDLTSLRIKRQGMRDITDTLKNATLTDIKQVIDAFPKELK